MKMKKEDLITLLKKSISRIEKGYVDDILEIEYMKELVDKLENIIKFEESEEDNE